MWVFDWKNLVTVTNPLVRA